MTSGYDDRSRVTDRLVQEDRNYLGVVNTSAISRKSQERVISFRSDVKGTPLDSRSVDLYAGFFVQSPPIASYLNPGPRFLSELESAGLAEKSDYRSLNGLGFDNGHPFSSTKTSVNTSHAGTSNRWWPNNFSHNASSMRYGGPVYHSSVRLSASGAAKMPFRFGGTGTNAYRTFAPNVAIESNPDTLASDGTRAIALCAPSVPRVSTAAIVGELLTGFPLLPGWALKGNVLSDAPLIGGFGDEYLNTVFGLIPTVSDAQKLSRELLKISRSLHQFRRDAGKRVRRSFYFPETIFAGSFKTPDIDQVAIAAAGAGSFGFNVTRVGGSSSSGIISSPPIDATELFISEKRKTWFKGSFTYFMPEIPGYSGRLEKYLVEHDRILGLQLDTRTAWQLMPWSWLIDWFTDIRENIAAIEVAHDDNLVMNYGYAMEESVRTAVAKTMIPPGVMNDRAEQLNTSLRTTTKRRVRANPYGFVGGSDGTAWTPYRLAVLAALGITRV